eukprot:scaffold9455_cov163-Amphora_coffeaeformis.AAC.5
MISQLANSSRHNSNHHLTTSESRGTRAGGGSLPNAIFSSIGLGIVNDFPVESTDATEAAFKAVQDAIERGGLGLTVLQNLVLSVRVGVPGRAKQPSLPMHVDVAHLTPLVPPTVSLSRLEVVIGGLMAPVSSTEASRGGICSAVACLSFFQQGSQGSKVSGAEGSPFSARSPTSVGEETSVASDASAPEAGTRGKVKALHCASESSLHDPEPPRQRSLSQSLSSHANPKTFMRANSMELLARISSEIRDQQPDADDEAARLANAAAHNYKKLPPGKTPKNNKRLFVRHEYHDFSRATPSAGEEYLVRPDAPLRTPNAAFPLKLHETLAVIERDGLDHVIGWMPHGRSFKIHKHQEFVDDILPKYFVMTKKSSFLRQLNLYGFNRLSGSGPDQGSYYHEKFLRGLKFLCRRMARIKVNGNGIRAAGNPDDEPNFAIFPNCPPDSSSNGQMGLSMSDQEGEEAHVNSDTGHSLPSLQAEANPDNSSNSHLAQENSSSRQQNYTYKTSTVQQHSFPLRLQRMLDKLEADGNSDIVSWCGHGRAFVVHDPDRFVSELMPVYFNQTKYSSFQRQLHMYNFSRITSGRDKGAYWNIYFQRGKPSLTVHMPRTRINGKGTRRPAIPELEPDLWKDPPLPPIKPGTTVLVPAMPGTPLSGRQYHEDPDDNDVSDREEV